MSKTYDGPVFLAQDLTVINVTSQQSIIHQAQTDLLHWSPPPPKSAGTALHSGS
jgi:hypothetical protein